MQKKKKKKEKIQTIILIIFRGFLIFYQTLLSPQVKRCAIISYKHDIYESSHELLNNLRRRILENKEISGKCVNLID